MDFLVFWSESSIFVIHVLHTSLNALREAQFIDYLQGKQFFEGLHASKICYKCTCYTISIKKSTEHVTFKSYNI